MTTISTRAVRTTTTTFERILLRTSTALDSYVGSRLERRAGAASRRAVAAQITATASRSAAQARGAIGILPR